MADCHPHARRPLLHQEAHQDSEVPAAVETGGREYSGGGEARHRETGLLILGGTGIVDTKDAALPCAV